VSGGLPFCRHLFKCTISQWFSNIFFCVPFINNIIWSKRLPISNSYYTYATYFMDFYVYSSEKKASEPLAIAYFNAINQCHQRMLLLNFFVTIKWPLSEQFHCDVRVQEMQIHKKILSLLGLSIRQKLFKSISRV
jgi:hypothetical protein